MKVLILDIEGEATALDMALRMLKANHSVQYWQPPHQNGERLPYGKGLVQRPLEWEPLVGDVDLIVVNGNSRYHAKLGELVGAGYPVFGFNLRGAELELDRAMGQALFEKVGIPTLPYTVVKSAGEGIQHIIDSGKGVVLKPWGGEADKAMTFVAKRPEDGIFVLQKWEREGLFKGQLMLQELAEGIEVGIAGWFGPHGWSRMKEESFEHKKLMVGDLGPNTGEMGTVIRHVSHSKLFDKVLEPLTEYLHSIRYIGDVAVNCIIDDEGTPWPLEFTCRFGHPDLAIRHEVMQCDPAEWMLDIIQGKDGFRVSSRVAVGVVLAHGDFPFGHDVLGKWADYPISTEGGNEHIHWQMVMQGTTPTPDGGRDQALVTAGNYVAVVSGSGMSVTRAAEAAYDIIEGVHFPSDIMYRLDIGQRLKKQLPKLQKLGYALGMEYA